MAENVQGLSFDMPCYVLSDYFSWFSYTTSSDFHNLSTIASIHDWDRLLLVTYVEFCGALH